MAYGTPETCWTKTTCCFLSRMVCFKCFLLAKDIARALALDVDVWYYELLIKTVNSQERNVCLWFFCGSRISEAVFTYHYFSSTKKKEVQILSYLSLTFFLLASESLFRKYFINAVPAIKTHHVVTNTMVAVASYEKCQLLLFVTVTSLNVIILLYVTAWF